MSESREHRRRYNKRLEFIARFENWLEDELPMLPLFWRWRKWRDIARFGRIFTGSNLA